MTTAHARLRGLLVGLTIAGMCLAPRLAGAQLTEADIFVAEGILALEDKQYDAALGHFARALQREPGHIEALYYSGVAYLAKKQPAQALPFLEQAYARSPTDVSIAYQLGLAHFAVGQYDRAEALLEDLFGRDPTLDSLGYYVGFLRYRKGAYKAALDAFRVARTTDPNLAQVTRLYTGLALAQLGLPAQAAAEIEAARRLLPASPLTGPMERLRTTISAAAGERRFRVDARVGAFHDDNVRVHPDPRPGDLVVDTIRHGRTHSVGEIFSVRAEYAWWQAGPWQSTVSYSFYTSYNNALPSFNLMDHLGTLGLSHQGQIGYQALYSTVQYSYEFLLLGAEEFLQRHSILGSSTLVESPNHFTTAQAKIDVKEYSETRPLPREEFLDGVNWMVGLLHIVRFSEGRHLLKVGYQFDLDDTRGSNLDYLGHRAVLGGVYTLPWWDIRLNYDFNVHFRNYRNRHSLFPIARPRSRERVDRQIDHFVRAELPLPQNFTLGFDYFRTDAESNFPVFDYTRNVFTLSLSWQY